MSGRQRKVQTNLAAWICKTDSSEQKFRWLLRRKNNVQPRSLHRLENEENGMKATNENAVQTTQAAEYVFDNAGRNAEERYRTLSCLYDANTIRHLKKRGVEEGWSCLEVAAGGGSIASWLCLRVGPSGQVVATDIDPRFLQTLPHTNLEVRRHDIRVDELPASQFDLVHARLLLVHLPERERALRRMVESLKPGGWIVLEEFDALSLLPDPTVSPAEVDLKIRHAFHEILTDRSVDLRCGRLLVHKLRAHGLVNIGVEASVSLWGGQSVGASHMKLSFEEMRGPMLRSGLISQEEFEADLKRIDDHDFLMPSPMMWTAWGAKAGSGVTNPVGGELLKSCGNRRLV